MENLNSNEMLKQTTPITCENCGNNIFTEGIILRKVSRILMGDTKDGIFPIPVFVCSKCGHVNKKFLPKGLEQPKSNIVE